MKNSSDLIIYTTEDGLTKIDVTLDDDTVWLTQEQMAEAKIAKNYLDEKELRAMGQLVSGYLDFAERQAERGIAMTMADWANHLDGILTSTGEKLLIGNGTVSHLRAMEKVEEEYKKYKTSITQFN